MGNRRGKQAGIFGRAAEGVPAVVHAQMEDFARMGALPITRLEHRERNKPTSGSEFGVPPFFSAAHRWGYLAPDLKAPEGYKWIKKGTVWLLQIKGG